MNKTINNLKDGINETGSAGGNKKNASGSNEKIEAIADLEQAVYEALETYANVHRGSGHNSMVSTHLFEQSRDMVLEYLELNKARYIVVFCTPRRAEALTGKIDPGSYQMVSSRDIGLPFGVRALAIKRNALPKGNPQETGGGTTRLMSQDWVIWANAPDKFEAGTPAIINIIAFAKALQLIMKFGKDIFKELPAKELKSTEILYHDTLKDYTGKELLDKLRHTLIGRDVRVPTIEGPKSYTNLDNSASTPTFAPIWEAFSNTLRQTAQVQQKIVHEVKLICSEMLGAPLKEYDVIFTSNTTESINLAAESLSREFEEDTEPIVLNTILEHSSNDLPWRMIPGYSLIRLSVDNEGFIDLGEMKILLSEYNKKGKYGKKRIKLVAISGASNVLGTCNDIAEISRIAHSYGTQLLVDAAQLVAHRKVDMEEWGIDYLAFSAHKVYAPFGCGVLIARKGLLSFSSTEMEIIQSLGEENVGGIAALGKAFDILQRIGMDLIQEDEQALTDKALRRLSKIKGLEIYGIKDSDSPRFAQKLGVIVFIFKNKMADKVAKQLANDDGIGVRNGCLCAHIIVKHILKIGPGLEKFQRLIVSLFPKLKLPGVVRVSFGIENNEGDVDVLIHALQKIAYPNKGELTHKGSVTTNIPTAKEQKQMNNYMGDWVLKVF